MMQHELALAKNEVEKKAIRKDYRPFMFRDSKLGRDSWDNPKFDYFSPQFELLSDSMIDKITSLYGYAIKANTDGSLLELRNLLLAIVYHLSATDNNFSQMHQFCPGLGEFLV